MNIFVESLLALLLMAVGCARPASRAERAADQAWPIVYGDDGRIESYELMDERLRRNAQANTFAIMTADMVSIEGGKVQLNAQTLAEVANLCPEERFLEQPAAAACSGVLVDEQTVLTADHCARALGCEQMRLLHGYFYEAEGRLHQPAASDVYHCKSVVSHALSAMTAAERFDYAFIELDHRVTTQIVPIVWRGRTEPLVAGEPLSLVGFPEGLPLKVDQSGSVGDPREGTLDYFVSNVDAFHGNSGAPVFDAELRLVGIEGRGADDYTAGIGCSSAIKLGDDRSLGREQATYAFRAREAYCSARPDALLCCDPGIACKADLQHARGCNVARVQPHASSASIATLLFACAVGAALRQRTRRPPPY